MSSSFQDNGSSIGSPSAIATFCRPVKIITRFACAKAELQRQKRMPLPAFDEQGDLPVGVHQATFDEVLTRFGHGTLQRQLVTAQLMRIYELARATGKLLHFVIFGSYVTAKPAPNDIDIILVMRDDFEVAECDEQTQP